MFYYVIGTVFAFIGTYTYYNFYNVFNKYLDVIILMKNYLKNNSGSEYENEVNNTLMLSKYHVKYITFINKNKNSGTDADEESNCESQTDNKDKEEVNKEEVNKEENIRNELSGSYRTVVYNPFISLINNRIVYKDNLLSIINDKNEEVCSYIIDEYNFIYIEYVLDSNYYDLIVNLEKNNEWEFPSKNYLYGNVYNTCAIEYLDMDKNIEKLCGPKGNFHSDIINVSPDDLSYNNLVLKTIFGDVYYFDKYDNMCFL